LNVLFVEEVMPVMNLVFWPHPALKSPCEKVEDFGDNLSSLCSNLQDSLRYYKGLGLAAPQIGDSRRVFILDLDLLNEPDSGTKIFVNPEILESKGQDTFAEGCLSLPGVTAEVKRSLFVKVRAQDEEGDFFDFEATGYTAAALQHELDHLNGILFFERLGSVNQRLMMNKYKKFHKKTGLGKR
jgi:peptide deformylase